MAKAKIVPSDQGGSVEFDELRRTVHTLLLILEDSLAAVVAAADATAATTALVAVRNAITNGTYSSSTLGTREVLGVIPKTKRHQSAQMTSNTITLNPADKNY